MAFETRHDASKAETPLQNHVPVKMTWSMHVCFWYSAIASVLFLGCLAGGGVNPRWEGLVDDDNWHAAVAVLLVFSLAVTELCIVIGGASQGELLTTVGLKVGHGEPLTLPGAHDAWLTLLEYLCKLFTGAYLYFFSGGVVHMDTLAVNGARPVYFARFLQWSVAVPLIVLITNAAFEDFGQRLLRRSWPSLWASWTYVWCAWLMEVTPHHQVRWPMMLLSLLGAASVNLDQFLFARQHRAGRLYNTKFGLLTYSTIVDMLYAVVFLMGRFGAISTLHEQMYYAYADASMKVLHGALLAMIRHREGTSEINRWFVAAMSAGDNLKDLISQATIPILTVDLHGNIMEWNDSLGQLTGFHEGDVKGKNIVDLSTSACKEDLRQNLARRMSAFSSQPSSLEAESSLLEVSLLTDSLSEEGIPLVRTLAMSIAAKRNSAGVLEGVTAIGQDLSEIADMKLVQERKDALMAMLGHEIRSPLHGIMGLTSALLEDPANKPIHRQLGMVKGCSARLLDLVNNVMDLAQNEKKKREGFEESRPTAVVDLSSIVDEAIVMIGNSVDKTNKPLLKPGTRLMNSGVGTEVPLVRGDAHKCTQLIYNLLTNACKFTERGSITVSFRHLPPEKRLEVDVTDTGKGISEAGQKRIFQPFEQEMRGDCRSFQGIGLGLAVCKEIAELHQGSLKVKSVVGQGSTFTLSLPCDGELGFVKVLGESAGKDGTQDAASVSKCTPVIRKEERSADEVQSHIEALEFKTKPVVLSVDDDEVNQEVIKNALRDICEVKCAMSGAETLEFFDISVKTKTPFPALVLLDIQMPGMTGFEVCAKIRATYEKSLSKLPVTMVSAKSPSDTAALDSFDSGCTDFVPKPFNTHLLRKKVIAALKMRESGVHPSCVSGIDVLTLEAQKVIKMHAEAAQQAIERTVALELELGKVQKEATMVRGRAVELEEQNGSLLRANESQKLEMSRISKERDYALKQASFSNTAPCSTSVKPRVNHVSRLGGSDDGIDVRDQEHGNGTVFHARETHNMRVAIDLLASRLRVCGSSAKQCKRLLFSSCMNSMTDSRKLVQLTATELTVLEHVASRTDDIVCLLGHDESTNDGSYAGQSMDTVGTIQSR